MTATREVTVRICFGSFVQDESEYQRLTITVKADGSDTLLEVKQKIAAAAGGSVTADDLLLYFAGNDTKMGRQFVNDPCYNEKEIRLSQFNALPWLERCAPLGPTRAGAARRAWPHAGSRCCPYPRSHRVCAATGSRTGTSPLACCRPHRPLQASAPARSLRRMHSLLHCIVCCCCSSSQESSPADV